MSLLNILNEQQAKNEGHYEILKSRDDSYYFNLKAGNGEIIATSQMYASKQSAKVGIESVKTNANSDVKDLT